MTTAQLAIAEWRSDPVKFVRDVFGVEPDPWQAVELRQFAKSPKQVFQSCAGSGKSCMMSWLIWNFMLTRPHPQIGAASGAGSDNLKMNLKKEVAYWYSKSVNGLLQRLFTCTDSKIYANDHPETWFLQYRTWAKTADSAQVGSSLRGLHGDYVMWIIDEAGEAPPSVLTTLENIFAGMPTEAHIVIAGNPTKIDSLLYEAAVRCRGGWHVRCITADPTDPERTPRVSVEHAQSQIDRYGRDNPYVSINILGEFPKTALNALIGIDEVQAAMERKYSIRDIGIAERVMGIDVARQGDDASAMCRRHGLIVLPFAKWRGMDSIQGAAAVAAAWDSFPPNDAEQQMGIKRVGADACFIDATGGFGAGWIDQLRQIGKNPIGVQYAGQASNPARFFNKRTEMYFLAVEWIRRGGALPDDPELRNALCSTTYVHKGDKLLLEPKADIKAKLGYSPDAADAFVQTFHSPVTPRGIYGLGNNQNTSYNAGAGYDPFHDLTLSDVTKNTHSFDPWGN